MDTADRADRQPAAEAPVSLGAAPAPEPGSACASAAKPLDASNPSMASGPEDGPRPPAAPWSRRQRTLLVLARTLSPALILALGRTLRIELPQGIPPGAFADPPQPAIYVFWHRCLLPVAWYARGRGFGVLISQHFDGELIAQTASRLGYELFRGSSTRGGRDALDHMSVALAAGSAIALTVDGPRGPCFRAKPGAIHLARVTGVPIYALHASCENAWTLKSWDRFQIPKPFSRVRGLWAGPIIVPRDAGLAEMENFRRMMEDTLNQLRVTGDASLSPHQHQEES